MYRSYWLNQAFIIISDCFNKLMTIVRPVVHSHSTTYIRAQYLYISINKQSFSQNSTMFRTKSRNQESREIRSSINVSYYDYNDYYIRCIVYLGIRWISSKSILYIYVINMFIIKCSLNVHVYIYLSLKWKCSKW